MYRSVSSEAHQRKLTTTETNEEPEIDLGEVNPVSDNKYCMILKLPMLYSLENCIPKVFTFKLDKR